MRNYFDISSMLGGTSSGSFSLTDYAMIKSGSYQKLMKAYYNKSDSVSGTKNNLNKLPSVEQATDKISSKSDKVDTTGITRLKAEADSLKKNLTDLTSADLWKTSAGEYDKANITKAVKGFVEGYNKVVDQSSKVKINSSDIDNNMRWMTSMTNTMSKALSKIGISVGADNKLSINDEAFAKADMKNVKSLFEGSYSYGGQIEAKAQNLANTANTTGIYNNQAFVYNSMQSMFSVGI